MSRAYWQPPGTRHPAYGLRLCAPLLGTGKGACWDGHTGTCLEDTGRVENFRAL